MNIGGSLIGKGIALGIGAAVPIGPVNVEIARRTFRGGFPAGVALGAGAVSVDVSYAILSSFSFHKVLNRPAVIWPISIAGIIFLLYLSFLSIRGAARDWLADPLATEAPVPLSRRGSYFTGVVMTLLNPMTLGFWFLAVPAALGGITKGPSTDLPMICAGVFIGTSVWVLVFTGTLAWAGRWRRRWWLPAADALGGLVLFFLAAVELWRALRPFI